MAGIKKKKKDSVCSFSKAQSFRDVSLCVGEALVSFKMSLGVFPSERLPSNQTWKYEELPLWLSRL